MSPPCINNNEDIIVSFGEMMATRVDGNHYRVPVNYTLDCKILIPAMKLQMQGSVRALTVHCSEPIIRRWALKYSTTRLHYLSIRMNFTYPDKPELWAVPVKHSG